MLLLLCFPGESSRKLLAASDRCAEAMNNGQPTQWTNNEL